MNGDLVRRNGSGLAPLLLILVNSMRPYCRPGDIVREPRTKKKRPVGRLEGTAARTADYLLAGGGAALVSPVLLPEVPVSPEDDEPEEPE